jgi:hypothetical protein
MAASSNKLTKAETVALWHAVSNYELMVRQMKNVEGKRMMFTKLPKTAQWLLFGAIALFAITVALELFNVLVLH